MHSLFNKLKKDYFGPILTHFLSVWAKEIFLKKTGSLTPCQNLDNTDDPIPRKLPNRWKGGQTLFFCCAGSIELLPLLLSVNGSVRARRVQSQ